MFAVNWNCNVDVEALAGAEILVATKQADRIEPEGIDAELVRQHLMKMEFSETFNDLEHQRRVLRFLVEQRLDGRQSQLTQSEIVAAKIVGRSRGGPTPELLFPDEQSVRTHIARLRRSLLAYYRYEAPAESFQIDIPKRRYLALFVRAASPTPVRVPTETTVETAGASAENLTKSAVRLYSAGQYAEAEPILKQALLIRERALGPEHPDTATSLNNLAMLYEKQGKHREALPILERALVICEKALGPEHPDTIIGVNNLAIALISQGSYQAAAPLLKRALALREQLLGDEHPDTGKSVNNLAMLYEKLGQYRDAVPLLERALGIREKTLGAEHHDTAMSLNNLAMLYQRLARYAEAGPLFERGLAIAEKILGAEHPDTTTIRQNYLDFVSVYRPTPADS